MSLSLARGLAFAWLAFVLPGDRVIGQLVEARSGNQPLRVEAKLTASDSSAPAQLVIEISPDLGARISDGAGGRWLFANGRVSAGTRMPPPNWLPDLSPLLMRRESELRSWLAAENVDLEKNELARCGDGDCWVLGTRAASAQLWIEKSGLDVRKVVRSGGASTSYDDWQLFGKIRFPSRIALTDGSGPTATLAVQSVSPIALGAADLSPSWLQTPASAKGR